MHGYDCRCHALSSLQCVVVLRYSKLWLVRLFLLLQALLLLLCGLLLGLKFIKSRLDVGDLSNQLGHHLTARVNRCISVDDCAALR